jgi:adenine specific DNA methylase Mod
MPRLTEQEQQEIIRYLEADKPLPDRYRFLLFEQKREVELVWNGKTSEVCNIVLPFQVIEQVDEPRAEKDTRLQMTLFDLDDRGRQLKGWTNKLIWGDNKLILSSLKNGPLREEIEAQGGIKLIYIDPPFDVGADFSMDIEIGGDTFTKKPNILEEIAYRDTWGKGADSYLAMIYQRLVQMRDLLAEDGVIYVHIGPNINHLVRCVLDEVFGPHRQLNEIIWRRAFAHSDSRRCGIIHDAILFYAKSDTWIWNQVRQEPDPEYVNTFFDSYDENVGKRYQRISLTGPGITKDGQSGKPWRDIDPSAIGRHWAKSHEELDRLDREGRIHWPKKGVPRLKRYEDEYEGMVIQDIWTDINKIHNQALEATGYSNKSQRLSWNA